MTESAPALSEGIVDAILTDLDRLVDQALWAHGFGYAKAGRGLDSEHGVDLSRTEQERSAGPTYDLEIGSHQARVAYQQAVRAVSRADRVLAAVLVLDGVTFQRPTLELTDYARPAALRLTAARVRWRLSLVDADRHRRHLNTIRVAIDRAVRGLGKALDHGATVLYTKHRENPCRTCGIRERAAKKAECDTCATWRQRHDGKARPVELDLGPVRAARAAQARRHARGEGWGEG